MLAWTIAHPILTFLMFITLCETISNIFKCLSKRNEKEKNGKLP
jgi:hypothetical protein